MPEDRRPTLRRRGQGQRVPVPVNLPAVIELAAAHGIEVTADVRALAAIAAGRAAERAVQPQVRLDEPDGTIIIDASLGPALYEKVRELGGRWDRAARVHRVPGHHAPELTRLADEHGLRISGGAPRVRRKYVGPAL